MLYFILVSLLAIGTTTASVLRSELNGETSLLYALCAPLSVIAYVLILLGIITLLLRLFIRQDSWKYDNWFFTVREKEMPFYEFIGIRRWKGYIPEMGKTGGFPKDRLTATNVLYLRKFLQETCFAETLHYLTAVIGFTALGFFPVRDYYFVIPILIVNFILNLLPAIIQRFTRYRLYTVYKHKVKQITDEKTSNEN